VQSRVSALTRPASRFRLADALALPSWLLVVLLFAAPIAFLCVCAFGTFDYDTGVVDWGWTLDNLTDLFSSTTFTAFLNSIVLSVVAMVTCIVIGYPIAYAMSLAQGRLQNLMLLGVIVPFWTSFVVRVYAWLTLLAPGQLVSKLLHLTGLFPADVDLSYTRIAIFIGMVYCYLPLAILPIFSALQGIDRNLVAAAQDLGHSPTASFFRITVPLSLSGVGAAALLVGVPSLGEYTIPAVLGGGKSLMIGNLISNAFTSTGNYAAGSAISILLLVLLIVIYGLSRIIVTLRGRSLASRVARGSIVERIEDSAAAVITTEPPLDPEPETAKAGIR
jgi:spermidine/putrescine transport system permease protein